MRAHTHTKPKTLPIKQLLIFIFVLKINNFSDMISQNTHHHNYLHNSVTHSSKL